MAYSLRQLGARLQKVVTVTTTEVETDDQSLLGKYVFRDDSGEKHLWSPRPFSYEFHNVDTVAEADQIMFLCPACFGKNGGRAGTHSVLVTFEGRSVPDEASSHDSEGKPSRWSAVGTTIDDLVLTPSILLDAKRAQDQGCTGTDLLGLVAYRPDTQDKHANLTFRY